MQSLSERHWTQRPAVMSHTGLAALQSVSSAHCEHWALIGLQMGWSGGQAVAVRQPTHAPFAVSQVAAPGGHWVSLVQAVSHNPEEGQHAWPAAQSELPRQATHNAGRRRAGSGCSRCRPRTGRAWSRGSSRTCTALR